MTAIRKVLLVGMTIGALAVGGMSVAWACTPSGNIKADPGSGLAGSPVQLTGSGFLAPSSEAGGQQVGAVEIRWNSTSGPMLATATDAEFSTQVTVPQNAAARRYFFVAVQRRADGSIVRNAAAPFSVTAPAGEPAPPAPPANAEPPADEAPAAASASDEAAPAQPQPATATATAAPASPANPANATSRPAPRLADNGAAVARSTRSGDAAVAAPPTDPGEPAEAAAAPPSPPPTPEVSPRSVTGDLGGAWASGATGTQGPSLTDGSLPATRSAGSGLGLGLLTLGTATLLGGAFVGLRSRRRATSGSI